MTYKMKTTIANKANYGGKRSTSNIKYIVVHYTGNDGDTDEANAKYFRDHIVKASAHYFVDDDSITQSVPDTSIAYAVGGKYANKTGGGTLYKKCTNTNSISVELCDAHKNGKYDFTEKTLNNAADLIRSLMKKYNINIDHVVRHFDVNNKICPAPFVQDINAWNNFKNRIMGKSGNNITTTKPTTSTTTSKISYNSDVLELQKALNADGYKDASGKELSEDGKWGTKTTEVVSKCVVKAKYDNTKRKYVVGSTGNVVKFVQRRVGVSADGKFGSGTRTYVMTFQKHHGLDADGCAGPKTLKALCF